MEEGRAFATRRSQMELESVRDYGDLQTPEQDPAVNLWLEFDVSHMDRASSLSRETTIHESDSHLNQTFAAIEAIGQRMVGVNRALTTPSIQGGIHRSLWPDAGPSQHFRLTLGEDSRPASPDTQAAQCSSTASVDSQRPLLDQSLVTTAFSHFGRNYRT